MSSESPERAELDRERIFEQVTGVLKNLARYRSLILILEDLHCIDEVAINLLFHLVRRLEAAPVLLVGTYHPAEIAVGRDGNRHPWNRS